MQPNAKSTPALECRCALVAVSVLFSYFVASEYVL